MQFIVLSTPSRKHSRYYIVANDKIKEWIMQQDKHDWEFMSGSIGLNLFNINQELFSIMRLVWQQ